ncbi:MAG: glucose-6-phosphate dehydrogenase [Verrucomicrobia bacterium]|nr:glucose-6-phosphate dehydrogenase [Verrucomicrobiota bacterium]
MADDRLEERPVSLVIFGASGDLTQRKLVPALYALARKGRLPGRVRIVGFARRPYDNESFRTHLLEGAKAASGESFDAALWAAFAQRLSYVQGDLESCDGCGRLDAALAQLEGGRANRIYYLATSPELFGPVVEQLGAHGMAAEEDGWRRLVVEKPFGRDLASAQTLNRTIHAVFDEQQTYRIDHYLGKETAQNVLFFRFGNTIFEPVWDRRYVDHVQITVAESATVGRRGGYYDQAGVLRDMFQNHVMQLLALVAMEPPASLDADAIRDERVKVFSAIRPIDVDSTLCAQYEGYLDEERVAPGSHTPTFAAMKLCIGNRRWKGVPFYLRSGKAMATKTTEIIVVFREPPHLMFALRPGESITQNAIALRIQPNEGIHLRFEAKRPDSPQETRSVFMDFEYPDFFGDTPLPDAYERLLLDIINGDASLFTRSDAIEASWRLMDPVIAAWAAPGARPLLTYRQKSWGPAASAEFMARDGRAWRVGCSEVGEC